MSEGIEGEQAAAMSMFKKTGQLPQAKEGLSQIGKLAEAGYLSENEVGTNRLFHRMVAISKETPDNRFQEPQTPNVFEPNPDAEAYYRTMAEADRLEREAAKARKLQQETEEREAADNARMFAWREIARRQLQLRDIDKRISERESLIQSVGDLRTNMAEPSVPEQEILAIAADMPESAVVEYAKRTGDIDLLSQDSRISNETVLNVISYLADKQTSEDNR